MTTKPESPDSGAGVLLPCPFCHAPVITWQGHNNITFFSCSDPHEKFPKGGCGAIVSFRDGPDGKRGSAAFTAWNTRAQDSGQGEASLIRERDYWKGCAQATAKAWTSATPAQDAAGKGVEEIVADLREYAIACDDIGLNAIADRLAALSAKPAQDAGKGVVEVGMAVNCTVCRKRKQPIGRDAPPGSYMCNPHDCEGYRQDPQPGDLWPGETREQFGYEAKPAPACEKYREPTLADAHKVRHAYLNCEGVTTFDEDMLTALQSIGAVVPAREGES